MIVRFQQRNGHSWTADTIRTSSGGEVELVSDDEKNTPLTVAGILHYLDTCSRNIEAIFVDIGDAETIDATYYYIHDYHYENSDQEVVVGVSYIQ